MLLTGPETYVPIKSILSDDIWSDVIALCWRFTLLSRTFYPSVEAKCTLGVAFCRFSGLLLILAFKKRSRGGFWFG